MKIQIMNIFKNSFKDVWKNKVGWVHVAFAPFIVALLGYAFMAIVYWSFNVPLSHLVGGEFKFEGVSSAGTFWIIFANVVDLLVYYVAMFVLYINGYRYAALREGGDRWWTFNLDMRLLKLFLYFVLIGIFAIVYTAIAVGIVLAIHYLVENWALTSLLGALFVVFGFYLFLRIGLTLLFVSLDQSEPLGTSWRLLKGNVFRFFLLSLLIFIVIAVLMIVGALLLAFLGMALNLIVPISGASLGLVSLYGVFIWFLSWAVYSKALVLIYKSFTEGKAF